MSNLIDFSSGYYTTSLSVQPYTKGPVISNDVFSLVEDIYQNSDIPPLFRLDVGGGIYFEAVEKDITSDTLGLPQEWFSVYGIDYDTVETVYVVKPSHAAQLQVLL